MIQRSLLRVFSGLSILFIINNYLSSILSLFDYQNNIIAYIIVPILSYRSFKRCLSETYSFSLHLSLLICLIAINTGNVASGCLLVLMMPPFPPNTYQTIVSIFQIPPKAIHKNECLYQIFYMFGSLVGLCLHFLSLGTF
jgi:ABC-type polysaccharide/polyol phosphate export permease